MVSTNDFRTGLTIEIDGEVPSHRLPAREAGQGRSFRCAKLRNMKTGYVHERTFRAGEKVPTARVEYREMQYLYKSDNEYHVMDTDTYEQMTLSENAIGEGVKYLKENMVVNVAMYEGSPIGVQLPNFVELEVVETAPSFRGDTATGGGKPAVLETGATVQVPFFINVGDKIRVDTRTGEYLERV